MRALQAPMRESVLPPRGGQSMGLVDGQVSEDLALIRLLPLESNWKATRELRQGHGHRGHLHQKLGCPSQQRATDLQAAMSWPVRRRVEQAADSLRQAAVQPLRGQLPAARLLPELGTRVQLSAPNEHCCS